MGGDVVCVVGERLGPWWGSVEGLEGGEVRVGIDGVVLVLGALYISLQSSLCWYLVQKRIWA